MKILIDGIEYLRGVISGLALPHRAIWEQIQIDI